MKNNIQSKVEEWNVNQTVNEAKQKAKAYKEKAEKRFSGLSDANKKKVFAITALVIATTFFFVGRSCLGNDDLPPTAPANIKNEHSQSSVSYSKSDVDGFVKKLKPTETHGNRDAAIGVIMFTDVMNKPDILSETIVSDAFHRLYEYEDEETSQKMKFLFQTIASGLHTMTPEQRKKASRSE